MEFQLLWHQLLFKLFVKNFITTSTTLTKEEAIEKDPDLTRYKEQTSSAHKKRCFDEPKEPSKPMSFKNYASYKDVLPSVKTVNNYKQLLAMQTEADTANALFRMPIKVWCTLHYDMTSHCKIDGEWLRIIFSFSDKQQYVLRPIKFAYENRT